MSPELNLKSIRARKVRLWMAIGNSGYNGMRIVAILCLVTSIYCLTVGALPQPGYFLLALGLILGMLALWYKYDLSDVPIELNPKTLDDRLAPNLLARLRGRYYATVALGNLIQRRSRSLMCYRLFLDPHQIADSLSTNPQDTAQVWQDALRIAQAVGSPQVHAGATAAALILASPAAAQMLTNYHLKNDDVIEVYRWLDRQLGYIGRPRPYFGGIGRDWASGFTPLLEQFGHNVSHAVEAWGGYGRFAVHGDLLAAPQTAWPEDRRLP